ncbi:MAG: hypothetical protein MUF51_04590, partial [Vicinamibacteria bacterium]|nr:hypothetical protein [Vicinamibacteria bacterium]
MSVTRSIFVTLAVCAAAVAARAADKLDKEDKQWLDDVKVIILAEEEQTFKKITKAERAEFIKIFWARRNPLGPEADT